MSLFETAKYKTLKKETKNIELREYPTFLVAFTDTTLNNDYSNGFNNVFNYISGGNESKEKISMTTPVISRVSENKLTTGFVVPSKYGTVAPTPNSDSVYIQSIESGTFLVIKFKGSWSKKNFDLHDDILNAFITANSYQKTSEQFILRYQPPLVPGIFRKNEIMYKVDHL